MRLERLVPPMAVLVCAACDPAPHRVVPEITTEAGVEVATLASFPDALDSDYAWSFRVVREILTVTGDEPLVFDPTSVLELRSGELLVHDPSAEQPLVLVDTSTGEPLVRFGRKGQGPGELGAWVRLAEEESGALVALDSSNRQIHRFTSDGVRVSSAPYHPRALPRKTVVAPDGNRYVVETWRSEPDGWRQSLERMDLATMEPARLLLLPDAPASATVDGIQNGRALWTILRGGIVTSWSARPTVYVYDTDGSLVREIRLPLSRRDITDRDIDAQRAHYGSIANTLRTGPAALTNELYTVNDTVFGMFLSGLWRGAEDPPLEPGRRFWRLISLRGEYLGVIELEEGTRFLGTARGTIWIQRLDEIGYPIIQEVALEHERWAQHR